MNKTGSYVWQNSYFMYMVNTEGGCRMIHALPAYGIAEFIGTNIWMKKMANPNKFEKRK